MAQKDVRRAEDVRSARWHGDSYRHILQYAREIASWRNTEEKRKNL